MAGCRPYKHGEIEAMMREIDRGDWGKRDLCLYLFGLGTGYRVSEICSLTRGDVTNPDGTVAESVTVWRRNMKGKRISRTVVLSDELRKTLGGYLRWLAGRGYARPTHPLWPGRPGRAISRYTVYAVQKRAARRLGLPGRVATHSMRKTYGVHAHDFFMRQAARGVPVDPLLYTAKAMGHVKVDSTQSYLQADMVQIEAAVRDVSRRIIPRVPRFGGTENHAQ